MNTQDASTELRVIRRFIDGVDTTIALLLIHRRELTHLAIEAKMRDGLPIVDRAREDQIKTNYKQAGPGTGPVVRTILRWSRGGRRDR